MLIPVAILLGTCVLAAGCMGSDDSGTHDKGCREACSIDGDCLDGLACQVFHSTGVPDRLICMPAECANCGQACSTTTTTGQCAFKACL